MKRKSGRVEGVTNTFLTRGGGQNPEISIYMLGRVTTSAHERPSMQKSRIRSPIVGNDVLLAHGAFALRVL